MRLRSLSIGAGLPNLNQTVSPRPSELSRASVHYTISRDKTVSHDKIARPFQLLKCHTNVIISLLGTTYCYTEFQGIKGAGLYQSIIHPCTAKQLGRLPLDLPPMIDTTSLFIEGMGHVIPMRWTYAVVRYEDFEGFIDLYVTGEDYPPFNFVIVQDDLNRLRPEREGLLFPF